MHFGRILVPKTARKINGFFEGFWEGFWCDFGSKILPKRIQKSTWPNPKTIDFAWRVLQKPGFGVFPWHPKSIQKLLRKCITFLMIFGSLLAPIRPSKITQKCIPNRTENSLIFGLIFASILASFLEAK